MKQKFKIVDYSASWKDVYLSEKLKLIEIFGALLQSIHHIGSTAIPKTRSKPEIDILIVLKDVSSLSSYDRSIEDIG